MLDEYVKVIYTLITIESTEDITMTKAEKTAINAYVKELIEQGIDKELAKVMAKSFFDAGLLAPVVNGNY